MKTSAFVNYQLSVVNADGSIAFRAPEKRNLILDSGLNWIGTGYWAGAFLCLHLGTGVAPVKRDSGVITATISGGVLTASASFFDANDQGRLLKLDSGQEMKISGFSSSVSVLVAGVADSATPSEFTIYYVNRTTLGTPLLTCTSYVAGENGTVYDGALRQMSWFRTFLTPAFTEAKTLTEAGWGPSTDLLFGIDLMPVPVAITVGQQVKVKVTLTLQLPAASGRVANLGNNGLDTSGTYTIEGSAGYLGDSVNANGGGSMGEGWIFAPARDVSLATMNASWVPVADRSGRVFTDWTGGFNAGMPLQPYITGTFKRQRKIIIPVTGAVGPVAGIVVGGDATWTCPGWTLKFDTPQAKLNTNTWTFIHEVSWGRVLIN